MTERQSAPRRTVVALRRTGSRRAGSVRWEHELDCGHVEVRARRATTVAIGCVACGRPAAMREVASGGEEVLFAYWRSGLAARLRVPVEAVSVAPGADGGLGHAMVWLDAAAVRALLRESSGNP